jgi:hypothetical protein
MMQMSEVAVQPEAVALEATNVALNELKNEINDADKEPKAVDAAKAKRREELDLRITAKHIDRIAEAVKEVLDGRKLSPANMVRVVFSVMSVSKKMTDLPNNLKKKTVTKGLEKYVDEQSDMSEDEKEMLKLVIEQSVDQTVDVLAEASKKCCVIV